MYQFFESICVKNGIAENLHFHQARVDKTLQAFDASQHGIFLESIVQQTTLPTIGLFKLKVAYNLHGQFHTACTPYAFRQINNFALIDIKGQRYDCKFSNRDWINEALTLSGKNEIMMHDGGLIKDCSYTNIVFNDGVHWYTPATPLLEGTQRAKLIAEGIIQPKPLFVKDIAQFKQFKCINAMIHFDIATAYDIKLISDYL